MKKCELCGEETEHIQGNKHCYECQMMISKIKRYIVNYAYTIAREIVREIKNHGK